MYYCGIGSRECPHYELNTEYDDREDIEYEVFGCALSENFIDVKECPLDGEVENDLGK